MTRLVPLMLVALTGCAQGVKTAEETAAATQVRDDNYKKVRWIYGPSTPGTSPLDNVRMRALVVDSRVGLLQLYLEHYSHDWYFLNSATDRNGMSLDLVIVDRSVTGGAGVQEVVAITFERTQLDKAATTDGLDLRVDGKRGSLVIKIPSFYLVGFLRKVDESLR